MEKTKFEIAHVYNRVAENYNYLIDLLTEKMRDSLRDNSRSSEETDRMTTIYKHTQTIGNNLKAMSEQIIALGWWDGDERRPAERKLMNTTHEKLCKREAINKN